MSVFGINSGVLGTERIVLSGTGATTIVDATNKSGLAVVGILLVNNSGGPLSPVVDVYNGTTAFRLRDDVALADQAREVLSLPEFVRLKPGDLLRVTANTGLTVFASFIDMTVSRQNAA